MKLPKTLYVGYNMLKQSRVVTKKETDDEAVGFLQTVLNEAQPKSAEEHTLHRFVKNMYNENKYRFLSFIRNTNFECLVLWTESIAIVNYLGLRGIIYISWTGVETLYSITKHVPSHNRENITYKRTPGRRFIRNYHNDDSKVYNENKYHQQVIVDTEDCTNEHTADTPVCTDITDIESQQITPAVSSTEKKLLWGDMSD